MFERGESSPESGPGMAWEATGIGFGNKSLTQVYVSYPTCIIPRVAKQVVQPAWSDGSPAGVRKFHAGGPVASMNQEDQQLNLEIASAILLIDDNPIQAATRQTILRRAGYFVIVALNPGRALEQFQRKEFPAEISLVITDHIMPGMNGAQFVRELKKLRPDLPVMVISGLEEAEAEYEGMDVEFLVKPLSPDLMLAHLRLLLQHEEAGAA
jgi:CheY-like chemotaxis protein